jgi:hypothetical protein
MNNNTPITSQPDYTPIGFRTKSVITNIEKQRASTPSIPANEKMEKVIALEQIGRFICSDEFQELGVMDKVKLISEFADLKAIVNTFK